MRVQRQDGRHTMALRLLALLCVAASGHAAAQAYVFSSAFGSYGSGNGQFIGPTYNLNFVAIDPFNRNILVEDGGNARVEIFDANGTYLSQFGSSGSGNGQFSGIGGIAVDPFSHEIVVADGNNRIQVFSAAGAYLRQFGTAGSGNGQLSQPVAIAIDPSSHNVVVAELGNDRVQIFSSNGTYLRQFGGAGTGNGQFEYPCYLAIDPVTHDILVADEINGNVQVFDANGNYRFQFGTPGTGAGQFGFPAPGAIAVNAAHQFLVQDFGNERIERFDSSGNYIDSFGSAGNGNGQFQDGNGPTGMDIDRASGNLVILDRGNSRAEIFVPGSATDCGPTQVSLSMEPLTASLSESILFSAQASIAQPFGGTMSFVVDGVGTACVATVYDVYGTCTHPLALGTHSVIARYSGNGFNPPGCSAPASVTVVPDTQHFTVNAVLTSDPNPPEEGYPAFLNYDITPNPLAHGSARAPSAAVGGYVTFAQGSTVIGYATVVNNRAALQVTLPGGNIPVTATYSGDANYDTSGGTTTIGVGKPADDIFYSGMEIVR